MAFATRRIPYDLNRYLLVGLAISVALHFIFGSWVKETGPAPQVESIAVSLESLPLETERSLPSPKENQIVTPPKKTEEEVPANTRRLISDIDSSVKEERIKRGDAPDAGRTKTRGQKEQAPQARQPAAQPAPAKLHDLVLDPKTLAEKISAPGQKPENEKLGQSRPTNLSSYQAFSRPSGTGAAFLGTSGMPDYLPNLPDGDMTFLNTKASLYAVFVRRVAMQVFAALRANGWDAMRPQDVIDISDYATVRAILSPKGDLIEVVLEGSSSSTRFDEVVLQAAKQGATDRNPPKEAVASDGNYHFLFKSKSWVGMGANRRTGAPFERRWLLLATGLE